MHLSKLTEQGRSLSFFTAVSSLIVTFAVASFAIPMMAIWTDSHHLSTANIANTVLSYFVGCMVALLLFSRLSNFLGRKPVVSLSLLLSITASLLFAYSTVANELYVARFLQGLACGLASSAGMAWVVDNSPKSSTWLGTALTAASPNIGLSIGCLLTGFIVAYRFLSPKLLFELSIVLLCLCLILVFFSNETMRFNTESLTKVLVPKIAVPKRLKRIFVVSAAGFVGSWGVGAILQGFSARYAIEIFGKTDALLTALIYLLFIMPNAMMGIIVGKFDPARTTLLLISIFTIAALSLFLCIHFKSTLLFILSVFFTGMSGGGVVTATLRLLLWDSTLKERAGIIAALYFCSYVGSGAPNFIIGRMSNITLDEIGIGFSVWVLLVWIIVVTTLLRMKKSPNEAESLRFKR